MKIYLVGKNVSLFDHQYHQKCQKSLIEYLLLPWLLQDKVRRVKTPNHSSGWNGKEECQQIMFIFFLCLMEKELRWQKTTILSPDGHVLGGNF